MITQIGAARPSSGMVITWEPLPSDFGLEDNPVENEGQPLLAGALRESLELSGFIQPQMLIVSNFGLCATVNNQIVVKAPDWLYVPAANPIVNEIDRRSYTPYAEGDMPAIVMEFLSATPGEEYSIKPTYPPGKWFFYERILQVPIYVIFESATGLLEFYTLQNGRYELELPDENGRQWISSMQLFLGTWRGTKERRTGYWLRWWNADGDLLPWAVEQVEQERQRAESQRTEQERQQKEQLIAYL